jgi:chromosome segregation ATPase
VLIQVQQLNGEDNLEEFIEEIENQVNTNFKVTKIPIGILKEFKKLCKEDYGDIYWVGISELLKIKKQYNEILTLFSSLQNQIDNLKNKLKEQEEKKLRTFG